MLGSPYEANAWMFHGFQNEWTAVTNTNNVFLGAFLVLLVLQFVVHAGLPGPFERRDARLAAARNQVPPVSIPVSVVEE